MHTAAKLGGAVIFLGALAFIGRALAVKGQQSPNDGVRPQDNNAANSDPSTAPKTSAFDFGWVNGNDRAGSQTIAASVGVKGNPAQNLGDLTWQKDKSVTFVVIALAYDSRSHLPLGRWGCSWNVFDTNNISILHGTAQTDSNGEVDMQFTLTPEKAGVYRYRIAMGDAADEVPIVFNMPASVTLHGLYGD